MHGGGVGGGPRMWLHVGVFGAKERFDAVDSQLLDTVDEFTATVVAPARVAFGVLVGQDRTLGLHHGQRCIVLRSDHLQAGFLTAQLAVDQGGDVRVEGGQGVVEGVHRAVQTRANSGFDEPGSRRAGCALPALS
ncbi:Uncharacterised protein [Mycobacterium tuberculosis]|uniref:Uncharacterized protein n=1 Tax=Mycobacterium tuberculosis TaxID=1773 RepID=A0A916LCY0_MYCTX|nr:Uncharacterised protein [Mycobacterium tuberculosis]